jgi:hypothetical protein
MTMGFIICGFHRICRIRTMIKDDDMSGACKAYGKRKEVHTTFQSQT